MITLKQQHPGAKLDHGVTFQLESTSEVLSNPVVVVSDGITLVAVPAPELLVDNRTVVFWLTGGVSGEHYTVTITCDSDSAPRKYVQTAAIFVFDPTT